ncbi:MAG: cyclic nucleotide-binding domain-containing protein [Thermoanaerobaculia bacterium]|nr:cyclic nucleotide-binding domain-containing protein [Thermoanaerobaculia bacterium]
MQETLSRPAPRVVPGSEADYEERRSWAENLYQQGRVDAAVDLLEELAKDLAGAGNFPLAVAIRHQISQWRSGQPVTAETAAVESRKMVEQRAQSGVFRRPEVPEEGLSSGLQRAVKSSPFMDELKAEELSSLLLSTNLKPFEAGDVAVAEGSEGNELFVVTRGVFGVETGGPGGDRVRVGTLHVGDFFGEVALMTGKQRVATVTAEAPSECLEITREKWEKLIATHPRLKTLVEDTIRQRAQLSAEAMLDHMRKKREEG